MRRGSTDQDPPPADVLPTHEVQPYSHTHGVSVALVLFHVGPAWRNAVAGHQLSAQALPKDLLQAALLSRLPWLPGLQRRPPVSR